MIDLTVKGGKKTFAFCLCHTVSRSFQLEGSVIILIDFTK